MVEVNPDTNDIISQGIDDTPVTHTVNCIEHEKLQPVLTGRVVFIS